MLGELGGFLASLVGDAIGGSLGERWYNRGRQRRAERAAAAGRHAVVPGWVLGTLPYCRPAGGLLVVTADGVHHVVDRGMPMTRRDLPAGRLDVRVRRTGTWDDHRQMPADWDVLECTDGSERVLLACHRRDMDLVEPALERARQPAAAPAD